MQLHCIHLFIPNNNFWVCYIKRHLAVFIYSYTRISIARILYSVTLIAADAVVMKSLMIQHGRNLNTQKCKKRREAKMALPSETHKITFFRETILLLYGPVGFIQNGP